jgi:hypothetical protein
MSLEMQMQQLPSSQYLPSPALKGKCLNIFVSSLFPFLAPLFFIIDWYLCDIVIKTMQTDDLLESIYELAELTGAFHSNTEKTSIRYEDKTLVVRVMFDSPLICSKFRARLETMVCKYLAVDVEFVTPPHQYAVIAMPANLCIESADQRQELVWSQ